MFVPTTLASLATAMTRTAWAADLARKQLARSLPRRWSHTQGVAARSRKIAPMLGDHAELVEAAAWLHDIGYAPELVDTGFHPLDGARFLRASGTCDELCSLVAHHTNALHEARERGLADALQEEFDRPPDLLLSALTYCDLTTSPDGTRVSPRERINEILARYADDHPVHRAVQPESANLLAIAENVARRAAAMPRSSLTEPGQYGNETGRRLL